MGAEVMLILVTILILMSDGSPASKSFFQCFGIVGAVGGDDNGAELPDPVLFVDSRGAVIMADYGPATIQCQARHKGESWRGSIAIDRDRQVIRVYLKEQSHGSAKAETHR
jgi:hypothetical protein